jgi:hypothetical protein
MFIAMEHFSWDVKMKDVDSWRPTQYKTHFHVNEHSRNFPKVPIY